MAETHTGSPDGILPGVKDSDKLAQNRHPENEETGQVGDPGRIYHGNARVEAPVLGYLDVFLWSDYNCNGVPNRDFDIGEPGFKSFAL